MQKSILGRWVATVGTERIELRVGRDKQFVLGEISGTFILEESTLQFRSEDSEASYQYKISGNQLTLSGDDLSEPLVFLRQPQVTDYIGTWLNVSPRLVAGKLYRVFVIVAIVAWAGLLVWLLKKFDRWLVVTDSGPLKYLYRTHKNRALTVHSLVLNVIKYVIYFTALGYVLSELGINYTAYLASLSVVGLAIGFGSQGLVQDMVTGFFVIFENQYDVGDMVEISGQVGVVEELGLRMTRLRNYLGQTIVIPNRNIAIVGNFRKGAQRVHIDVAIKPESEKRATEILGLIGEEVTRQFPGIILAPPEVQQPLRLKSSEHIVRLALAIWPQQQWVVEQQLGPRIREALHEEGVELLMDRIAVYYHARKPGGTNQIGSQESLPIGPSSQ